MSSNNIEFRNHQRTDSYRDNHQRTNSYQEINLTDNRVNFGQGHENSGQGHMRQTSSIQEIVDLVKTGHHKSLSVGTNASESSRQAKRSPVPSILENNEFEEDRIEENDKITGITPDDVIINVSNESINGNEKLLINHDKKNSRIRKYFNKIRGHHFIGICILILCIVIISVFVEINNSIRGMTRVLSGVQATFANFQNDFDSDTFNTAMESFPDLIRSIRILSVQMKNNTNQMQSQPPTT